MINIGIAMEIACVPVDDKCLLGEGVLNGVHEWQDISTNINSFYRTEEPETVNDNLEDSPLLINEYLQNTPDPELHCHSFVPRNDDNKASFKLALTALFCFIFMIAELIGGYLAGSLAIMTDAAHLFSDFIGFLVSLFAIWIGRKPATNYMTFGYHRAEVVGALLSVITIWILTAIFSSLAINRLIKKEYEIEGNSMIIIAGLGLVLNIIMGGILHGPCKTHNHTHIENINVRAAVIHVLGDFFQSLGVLIAAIIIKIYPDAKVADPICTLLFSLIILCTTVKVGRDSIWYLIEGSPIDSALLRDELMKLNSVKHIHNLHIWTLAPGKDAVAVHLAVDKFCDRDLILKKATAILTSHVSFVTCTIQVEIFNEDLISSCRTCQTPPC